MKEEVEELAQQIEAGGLALALGFARYGFGGDGADPNGMVD